MRVGTAIISTDMSSREAMRRHGTEYKGKFTTEDGFDELLSEAGIVGYERQKRVYPGGKHYRLDFAFSDAMVNVEIDDSGHLRPLMVEHDKRRDEALSRDGWRILRLTIGDVVLRPDKCLERVRNTLYGSNSS